MILIIRIINKILKMMKHLHIWKAILIKLDDFRLMIKN